MFNNLTTSTTDRQPATRGLTDERAGDWRFLLPKAPTGRCLVLGDMSQVVGEMLESSCSEVVAAHPAAVGDREEGVFDLVAALRTAGQRTFPLEKQAGMVAPGGQLYMEIGVPALLLPPALLRMRLRKLGFERVRFYWPKPSFARCEMIMPLGDRRLQYYYLDQLFFAMSWQRRVLRTALRWSIRLSLFSLTLPGYMVIAVRPSADGRNH